MCGQSHLNGQCPSAGHISEVKWWVITHACDRESSLGGNVQVVNPFFLDCDPGAVVQLRTT